MTKTDYKIEQKQSLFRAGFKAEVYWGDEITAHHMNTRSVYRLKEDSNISITHSAKYVDDGTVDQFVVSLRKVTAYHQSGNVLSSVTETVDTFDNWLDAYYCAIQVNNNLRIDEGC